MKLINMKTKNFFLDFLFPIKCLGCGKEGKSYLCGRCLNLIPLSYSMLEVPYLDKLYCATKYNHPLIAKAVKEYKYRFVKNLSRPLAKILIKFIKQRGLRFYSPIVVAVPLSNKRFNWRGFNQSELITKKVARYFKWRIRTRLIIRIGHSKPQADMQETRQRKLNVKNMFRFNRKRALKNEIVILIDDIATTGSTLSECAKILKRNGAKTVIGLTIAHG